jgi:hypothetical protein
VTAHSFLSGYSEDGSPSSTGFGSIKAGSPLPPRARHGSRPRAHFFFAPPWPRCSVSGPLSLWMTLPVFGSITISSYHRTLVPLTKVFALWVIDPAVATYVGSMSRFF